LSGQFKSTSSAKPLVDYNLGRKASYVVAKSVLSSKSCPELENKLRVGLSYYETQMRTAEADLSNKIVGLISERDELGIRRVPSSSFVPKMKNFILGIQIWLKEHAVTSNCNHYFAGEHLNEVARQYWSDSNGIIVAYGGWYNNQIPKINPSGISKQLLSLQEVATVIRENNETLKQSFLRFKVPSYHFGNWELVRRTDLNRFLSQYPVKDFNKYPEQFSNN
jgi:hypothetical protein